MITRRRNSFVVMSAGLAVVTMLAACAPTAPVTPPVDPATCVRTVRTISPAPTRSALYPRIGADGRIGVFQVNDGTGPALPISFGLFSASYNIYRYDGVAETTTRINPLGTTSINPDLSRDGSTIAYATVTNSAVPTANLGIDVWSAATNSISRITGAAAGRSVEPVVSGDGRYIAFISDATTLITGDPDINANLDLFVYDRVTSTMRRMTDQSVPWQTVSALFGPSALRISDDGSTIILARIRNDNFHGELLSIDRASGAITVIHDLVATPSPNPDPLAGPLQPYILTGDPSADGSVVTFGTATVVPGVTPDPNGAFDVFVWTRAGSFTTELTSTPLMLPIGAGPISIPTGVTTDGRYVSFTSNLANPSDHTTDPPALVPIPGIVTWLYDRYTSAFTQIASHAGWDASGSAAAVVGTSGNDVKASICT